MKVVAIYEASAMGDRKSMQDVMCSKIVGDTAYLGVFDGHGESGGEVAEEAASLFQERIEQSDPGLDFKSKLGVVISCFEDAATRMKDLPIALASGTTATVALVEEGQLAIAYVGDSEAVYYPDKGEPIKLVEPHSKNNQKEVARCERLGYPLKAKYFGGELAVSRALGDTELPFVISTPDIYQIQIEQPGTLVLASDGVWGPAARSNHMAVQKVEALGRLPIALVAVGSQRTKDNASAIVTRINHC
jgi:protein phosphatase 1K